MSKQGARRYARRNGRLVRLKRPDAAANARPRKVCITGHGGTSKVLLKAPFDGRDRLGKRYNTDAAALRAHVGGDPTPTLEPVIDQAVRLGILVDIAWSAMMRAGLLVMDGKLHPAFEAFIKASRDHRAVLQLLGIERRSKPVPTLDEYLRAKTADQPTDAPQDAQPNPAEDAADAP